MPKRPSPKPRREQRADGLFVTYLPTSALKPHARNPRTHSRKQIKQISESIKHFGFVMPVLLDADDGIIAGHGRVEAAKLLGMTDVPTIRLAGMTEAQKRAYIIADNKLAENAGWDPALLRLELQYISEIDVEFDLGVIGFDAGELDLILDPGADPVADAVPPINPNVPAVSQLGDLWDLGRRHRLLCGDARDGSAYARLMAGTAAQMVFTDPPYNVRIDGHVCGLGRVQHEEFVMGAGEMSKQQFFAFLNTVLVLLVQHSCDGSIHFVCMDWRHLEELLKAGECYAELKNLCVWVKSNAGMGSFYRSKQELVLVFKNGTATHINNFELGQHGRYRTNVWDYPGVNSLSPGRRDELTMHPTVKPVALVADAIKDCSKRRGIILDPFLGSGTTMIAAEQTGRRCYGLELDPKYVDTVIRRWQLFAGESAVHSETGLTFAETERERATAPSAPCMEGADVVR